MGWIINSFFLSKAAPSFQYVYLHFGGIKQLNNTNNWREMLRALEMLCDVKLY